MPSWGIGTLTVHSFQAFGFDPDGDVVTYTWDLGDGDVASGPTATKTYNNANTFTYDVRVAAHDGRGGATIAELHVTSVTIAGTWTGNILGSDSWRLTLTQSLGGDVLGSFQSSRFGRGQLDPAEPGRIDAHGQFEFRITMDSGTDFSYRGTIDPTGRRLTGTLQGSDFTGQPMVLDKQ